MIHSWYVCPYDTVAGPGGAVGRSPAIKRYIPSVPPSPGPTDPTWDEAEILGNYLVVKVNAPAALHSTIRADADFRHVPLGEALIPVGERPGWRSYLTAVGYTLTEVNGSGWTGTGLLRLLTTAAGIVAVEGGIFTVRPGRRVAPKTVDRVEERLPTGGADVVD